MHELLTCIRKPKGKEESDDEIVLVRTVVKYVLLHDKEMARLTLCCTSDKRSRRMIALILSCVSARLGNCGRGYSTDDVFI